MPSTLTASQAQVIDFPYMPASTVKVVAGPGSGKTLTLLHKVHHLIVSGQVRPDEIIVLSLTNKAVDNVVSRLLTIFEELHEHAEQDEHHHEDHLKEIISQIGIHTIHGLASRVVIENEGLINVIEENGWRGLMKLVSDDFWKHKRSRFPNTKEFKRLYEEYKSDKSNKSEMVEKLTEIMQSCGVVTNDELIIRASDYLNTDFQPPITNENLRFTTDLKHKCKVVLIDEFQDLYPSLIPLLRKIATGKQLILFGDPHQSIYSFLGSNLNVIKSLERMNHGDQFKEIHLQDNFRCTPEIMSAATALFQPNHNNKGTTEVLLKKPCGVNPLINHIGDPIDELEFLTDQICQLVCASAKLGDIAVLTRTNAHLNSIAEHFQTYGLRYDKLTSQPEWMTDVRTQFLIDILKVVTLSYREENFLEDSESASKPSKSDFSIIVTLSALKGVGNQSIQSLYNECRRRKMSLWKYISTIPRKDWPAAVTNKKRIEFYTAKMKTIIKDRTPESNDPLLLLKEICDVANSLNCEVLNFKTQHDADHFKEHLEDMLKVMKMCSQNKPDSLSLAEWFLESHFEQSMVRHSVGTPLGPDGQSSIKLSTIHSSKGLEFPIVFLMGGFQTFQNFNQMEDNVLYVGMTRARNLLYLNNISHSSVSRKSNCRKERVLLDEKFWKYYNTDLKRRNSVSSEVALRSYRALQRRYGLSSAIQRSYATSCLKTLSNLPKYFARK